MRRDINNIAGAFECTAFSRGGGIALHDEATAVAMEHCDWCRSQGRSPEQVEIETVFTVSRPVCGWDDAIAAIVIACLGMRPRFREAA